MTDERASVKLRAELVELEGSLKEVLSDEERADLAEIEKEIEALERAEKAFESVPERNRRMEWLRHWVGEAVVSAPIDRALLIRARKLAEADKFGYMYIFDFDRLLKDGATTDGPNGPITLPEFPRSKSG